jgi:hypothetical protein
MLNPQIFYNNMEALRQFYPLIAESLTGITIKKYEIVQYDKCIPNVLVNGIPYYQGDMVQYFTKQFEGLKFKGVKQPVFLGMGLGYELMYFIQTEAQRERVNSIIIIEGDLEMFLCALNTTDLTGVFSNPKIKFFVGLPIEALYTTLRNHFQLQLQDLLMCGATKPVYVEGSMRIAFTYYKQALHTLYEAMWHSLQNFGNCPEDSLIGLENMLDNVKEILENPGINLLYEKFNGKPAVIVATGPSLRKNMHLLKGLEDKALILSCDASFKLLMRNGIRPHMVTSLEREHEVQQFFDNFDSNDVEDVYMAACPVLFNHVYESYTGPKIIVYRNFDHFKWLQIDRGILDIKLSSANMAYRIADALGCDPIILVGQDLAYGENGETHATQVPFSSEGEGIFGVKGNVKDEVKTNSGWWSFLKAFELDVADHKGRTINATEGGAYIPGTAVMDFETVIMRMIQESFDPLSIIKTNLATFGTVEEDRIRLNEIITQTESDVMRIVELCEKGVNRCKKFDDELSQPLKNNRIKLLHMKILEPRVKIQGEYGETFQKFLMHVVQSYHLKFEIDALVTCETQAEFLRKTINWYAVIGDISQICLDSLRKAKAKIES